MAVVALATLLALGGVVMWYGDSDVAWTVGRRAKVVFWPVHQYRSIPDAEKEEEV